MGKSVLAVLDWPPMTLAFSPLAVLPSPPLPYPSDKSSREHSMHRFYSALSLLALLIAQARAVETADWVIRAKYVITMDPQHRVIDHGAVAIRGDRIAGVGTQAEIAERFQAEHTLDRPDALLTPGLIDTHTHAAMSLFRAIATDMRGLAQ